MPLGVCKIFYSIKKINPFISSVFLLISVGINPIYAQPDLFRIDASLLYSQNKFLNDRYLIEPSEKNKLNISIKSKQLDFDYKFNFISTNKQKIMFDGSYINQSFGMLTFGAGAVDRNWSFSPKTSLILSSNARPIKSIYLSFNNKKKFQSKYTSWLGPTSIEFFNGLTENTKNPPDSMLMGLRTVFKPFKKLKIELVRTAYWGGKNYDSNLKDFINILSMKDTNVGKNKHANQMAGFGVSYNINTPDKPVELYLQVIGEDESGNLPSCLMYLAGVKWTSNFYKSPTILGIETVDTRIDNTKYGFCGPNTAYNNNTYQYTNYDKVMGVDIDTEGTSFEIYGSTILQNNLSIDYAYRYIVINDTSWSNHRLSNSRETGSVSSVGLTKKFNTLKLFGQISYHTLPINKVSIHDGLNFKTTISVKF